MKVASFPPEFLELFKAAAVQERRIGPLSESRAHSFRSRMNKLRVAMRKERHPDLFAAEVVTLRIEPHSTAPDMVYLVCTPEGDRDLVAAIRAAGVELPDMPQVSITGDPEEYHYQEPKEETDMESFLESFKSGDIQK